METPQRPLLFHYGSIQERYMDDVLPETMLQYCMPSKSSVAHRKGWRSNLVDPCVPLKDSGRSQRRQLNLGAKAKSHIGSNWLRFTCYQFYFVSSSKGGSLRRHLMNGLLKHKFIFLFSEYASYTRKFTSIFQCPRPRDDRTLQRPIRNILA
jgi:hypothetical protein